MDNYKFALCKKHKTVSAKDSKDGKEKNYTNYFLKLPNGNYVAIKPAFKNDYKTLYVLAEDIQ